MQQKFSVSRRRVLTQFGAGFAGLLTSASRPFAMERAGKTPAVWASPDYKPDVEIDLICRPDAVQILEGAPTRVWRYTASLVKGPEGVLTPIQNSYLGPIFRFSRGQKIRIRLRNELPEPTITHWHGLHVPMHADGHPMYAIDPGSTFIYEFEVLNRAGMNFFHPHTHEATATQVYRGLAGLILVNDEEERALDLPTGDFEIPLVIQDRSFNSDNQLVYGGGMHTGMFGFYGDRILVNGRPDYNIDVASRAYRLRILNGSNARIYKLAWDDGSPITVIGVDGGLLERPETKPYVMLAPAERLDIWADFSGRAVGAQFVMRSAAFSGVLPRMAERMMRSTLPVGEDYPVFTVRVTRSTSETPTLPQKLTEIKRIRAEDLANADNPVPIAITEAPMSMLLNGRPYAMDDVQPRERIPVNTTQLIEIFHDHGGGEHGRMGMMGGMGGMMGGMGMMSMAHPIHLHGQPFQIVERSFGGDDNTGYTTMRDGFINSGWKDTVLVTPGERLRIVKPFQDFKGRFMYHCHNLEHEDMGMMREFLIE